MSLVTDYISYSHHQHTQIHPNTQQPLPILQQRQQLRIQQDHYQQLIHTESPVVLNSETLPYLDSNLSSSFLYQAELFTIQWEPSKVQSGIYSTPNTPPRDTMNSPNTDRKNLQQQYSPHQRHTPPTYFRNYDPHQQRPLFQQPHHTFEVHSLSSSPQSYFPSSAPSTTPLATTLTKSSQFVRVTNASRKIPQSYGPTNCTSDNYFFDPAPSPQSQSPAPSSPPPLCRVLSAPCLSSISSSSRFLKHPGSPPIPIISGSQYSSSHSSFSPSTSPSTTFNLTTPLTPIPTSLHQHEQHAKLTHFPPLIGRRHTFPSLLKPITLFISSIFQSVSGSISDPLSIHVLMNDISHFLVLLQISLINLSSFLKLIGRVLSMFIFLMMIPFLPYYFIFYKVPIFVINKTSSLFSLFFVIFLRLCSFFLCITFYYLPILSSNSLYLLHTISPPSY